uniref:Uncharacterized protein n=1 Tax=Moschus moschiferus TaxID=68415 RepID=A0A8C6FKM6_MOSMO
MLPSLGLPRLFWMLFSCLMLLSQIVSQNELPSEWIRCPKSFMAYRSYCYVLFMTPQTWLPWWLRWSSGHQVPVLSEVEGLFMVSLVKNNLKIPSYVWIGLHYPTEIHLVITNYTGNCGSVSRSTRKKQRSSILPRHFLPLLHQGISESDHQRILLGQKCNISLSAPMPSHLSFLSVSFLRS